MGRPVSPLPVSMPVADAAVVYREGSSWAVRFSYILLMPVEGSPKVKGVLA